MTFSSPVGTLEFSKFAGILSASLYCKSYPGYLLTSYFCIPAPYYEKDIFFGC